MLLIQDERNERTIHRDLDEVADQLEAKVKSISSVDARLQFFAPDSFSFTDIQRQWADQLSLRIQHHVHDCVLYRMLIDDVYVCVFVLFELLRLYSKVVLEECDVLLNEIYTIYSPFLQSYIPDEDTGKSLLISLATEAKGMYPFISICLPFSLVNKSCRRILFLWYHQFPLFRRVPSQ